MIGRFVRVVAKPRTRPPRRTSRLTVAAILVSICLPVAGPMVWTATASHTNGDPECDLANVDRTVPFTDGCYHQGVWFNPDATEYDVIILPPTSPNELRDWQLVELSLDNWELGIKELGAPWLVQGLHINDYTVGKEFVPPEALSDPEVIVALHTGADPAGYLGLAAYFQGVCHGVGLSGGVADIPTWHAHPGAPIGHFQAECGGGGHVCTVTNVGPLALDNPSDRRVHFDLISHEIGHCLTLGHVGDATTESLDDASAYPADDIMSYESDGHHAATMHCPSTLDVRTIENAFSNLLGQGGSMNNQVANGAGAVYTHMHPDDWRTNECEQSAALFTDVDWLSTFDPTADDEDEEPDTSGTPTITVDSPVDGTRVDAGPLAVSGSVDRAGTGPDALAADAGGPYSGDIGEPIAITGAATGGSGAATCAWSGPGAFADAAACATTALFDAAGAFTIALTVTDGEETANDQATVTVTGGPVSSNLYFGSTYTRGGTDFTDCGQRYTYTTSPTVPDAGKAYSSSAFLASACAFEFAGTTGAPVNLADSVVVDLYWACDRTAPMSPSAGVSGAGSTSRLLVRLRDADGALLGEARYTEEDPTRVVCDTTVRHTPLTITGTAAVAAGALLKVEVTPFLLSGDSEMDWMEKNMHVLVGGTQASGLLLGGEDAGAAAPVSGGASTGPGTLRPTGSVSGIGAATAACGELTLIGSDSDSDSLAFGAEEVLCMGADQASDRFVFSVEVADAESRQHAARSVFYDFYFQPDFGLLAGTRQLVSIEYTSDGDLLPFWDVGGNDPTGIAFPTFFPDPTRTDVQAARNGNVVTVSFPMSYLGDAADGDQLVGVYVDANDCGAGTTCVLRHADLAPDGQDGQFTFGASGGLAADAGGPYAGGPGAAIAIDGAFAGGEGTATCTWSTSDDGAFADVSACATSVTFSSLGAKAITLTVADGTGSDADEATVTISDGPVGERVQVRLGETVLGSEPVSTGAENPSAPFAVDIDLTGFAGEQSLTAEWFDADGSLLVSESVTVIVGSGAGDTILILEPEDNSTLDPGVAAVSGSVSRAASSGGNSASATAPALNTLGEARKAIAFVDPDLVVDLIPDEAVGSKASRTGPPVPSPSDGLGPGTPVLARANGFVGLCTANYVWKDQNGDYYLGAAGHCFFLGTDETKVATHGPGADMPSTSHITVQACVAQCAFGGANLLADAATGSTIGHAIGDLVPLGSVAYARQGPQIYGEDFGLVKIPEALEPMIRPEMPVWNGPVGTWTPPTTDADILGNPTFVYGNGIGLGETFLTKARAGTWSFANEDYPGSWVSDTPASQGDSGSAVNFGARTSTSEVVESRDAMGILTHLFGHPITAGTMVQKAAAMATEAGLTVDFLLEGDTVEGGGGGGGGTPTPETWYAHQTACLEGQSMNQTDSPGDFDGPCFALAALGEIAGELGTFPATAETRGANTGDEVDVSVFVQYDETVTSLSTVTAVLRADGVEVGRGSHQQLIDPLIWLSGWVEYDIAFELTSRFDETAALTWQVYHEGSARANMGFEDGHASSMTIQSTVAPPNEPPVADAGPDQTVTEGEVVNLVGACEDPESSLASCTWSQMSGPAVTITDNGDGTASFTAPDVGSDAELGFRLTAIDADGAADHDDAAVLVRTTLGSEHVEIWIAGSKVAPDLPVGPTGPSDPSDTWLAEVDFTPYEGTSVMVEARWLEGDGTLIDSATVRVTVVRGNEAPAAVIAASGSSSRGEDVQFDGTGSNDTDGVIVSYAWDFGDGTTAAGASVVHTYASLGTYSVLLTVTDDDGATATATHEIEIVNAGPSAAINGPASAKKNKDVVFSGAESADSDGTIVAFAWDLGDGTTASGVDVTHRYKQDGTYTVTLAVQDSDGATSTATHTITVTKGNG